MNKIYLFGKIIFKSKLKYIISPKLKLYLEVIVETISGDNFNCIVYENECELIKNIKLGDYIFIEGIGVINGNGFNIYINKLYI